MTNATADIERLAEAGLLTEQEAAAFVHREIRRVSSEDAAESMDVSPEVVETELQTAMEKLDAAAATRSAIEELRRETQATTCDECGGVLTRPFSERDGAVICFTCSGSEFVMGGGGGAAGRGGWIESD